MPEKLSIRTLSAFLRAGLFRGCAGGFGGACVGDPPDRPAGIVGDEQRAVLGDRERRGAAPHLGAVLARSPKAGGEILVMPLGLAVLERHAHDLVPGWFRAVPRALHGDTE